VQTPRFCGLCCSAGTFFLAFWTWRGFAINWLMVGMLDFAFTVGR
jgi:hypothetical protein